MDYTQAVLGMVCIGAIKMVDLTDPDMIFYARCLFATGASVALSVLALLYFRIQSANDTQQLVMTNADKNPPAPMAALMGAPADPDAGKSTTMTVREYDEFKLQKLAQSVCTTLAITVALHAWKGFMPPLVLQSVLAPAGLLGSELAKLHLFGQTVAGNKELRRPWKPKSAFSALTDIKKEMKQMATPGDDKSAPRKNKKAANMKKTR